MVISCLDGCLALEEFLQSMQNSLPYNCANLLVRHMILIQMLWPQQFSADLVFGRIFFAV